MARQSDGPWFREATNAWYVTIDGRKVSLRVRGPENRKAAVDAWHKRMAEATNVRPDKSKQSLPTVTEVLEGFLGDASGRVKPKTLEVYRYFLDSFSDEFGSMRAAELKPHTVERFSRKPTWGPTTRHDFIGTVVSAFRWAERFGLIPRNPLAHVRKPAKVSRGAKVVLTDEQFGRLCKASSPAFRLFLRGLWLTGARPGELTRLTASDVEWDSGVILLDAHKTAEKTGRPRIIYLSAEALTLFRQQAAEHPSGPLFTNSVGGAWTEDAIVNAMRTARERAELPNAVAYGMRHSFATAALVNGIPDAHVAALLGHTNTSMIHKHYSHVGSRADVLRNAAALVRPAAG